MRNIIFGSICSLAMTASAFATDYPNGVYLTSGIQMCLSAPSGFSNDAKGNPTIPNGTNSFFAGNTYQGLITYHGDGTGQIAGTFTSINPPMPGPGPKPSLGGGTFAFEFTNTPIVDHRFSATSKPGTDKGIIDFGTAAGQSYSIDSVRRDYIVSDDQKTMAVTIAAPFVETITYSGSSNVHIPRSCMITGNQTRVE